MVLPPDPPPTPPAADTDPARPTFEQEMTKANSAVAKTGITFKTATEAMKNFAASMQRVGDTVGAAFGDVMKSARDFERAFPPVPLLRRAQLLSDTLYTEAEVSEIDAEAEAGGTTRYWWQKVGVDRWRYVPGAEPQRDPPVDEMIHTPIGVAVEPGRPGEFVTVQLAGLDENGVPINEPGIVRPLPPDQRPHPGPLPRRPSFEAMMRSAERVDSRTTAERNARFPDGMSESEMANVRRPAERDRHVVMEEAIVDALRSVAGPDPAITEAIRSMTRRPSNPDRDEIGNGVTHEELQNATTPAQRYDVLWRAGLIDGPYDKQPRVQLASRPVVPEDPRKRRLRIRRS